MTDYIELSEFKEKKVMAVLDKLDEGAKGKALAVKLLLNFILTLRNFTAAITLPIPARGSTAGKAIAAAAPLKTFLRTLAAAAPSIPFIKTGNFNGAAGQLFNRKWNYTFFPFRRRFGLKCLIF